uniref:Putative secreted protein ovary overexpressed n=1 Tax=Rhipicephalus microplus TaxID=6941 RepID=A0A6M2DBL6_RHIMP
MLKVFGCVLYLSAMLLSLKNCHLRKQHSSMFRILDTKLYTLTKALHVYGKYKGENKLPLLATSPSKLTVL